jgi:hypothetical protein
MTQTLVNDLHTEVTASFARTPAGELFIANGIDRPRKWDGFSSAAVVAGLDAPTTTATVTEDTGGASGQGLYTMAVRFGDAYGNYSNLSPVTEVTTTGVNKEFNWSNIPVASGTASSARITLRQLFRTTVGEADIFYLVTTINDNTTTTYTDQLSDAALVQNAELPILNDDDTLNANRFGVPPMNKAIVVWNQDRMFYMGDVVYSTGTVSLTNASGSVTGSGTGFSLSMVGKWLYAVGDSRGREITAYSSATGITVSPVYTGSNLSNVAYEIRTAPAERNVIYFSETEEPESVPQSQNQFLLQENNTEQDDIVGAFSDGGSLVIGMTGFLYRFDYVRQPQLDGAASVIARRGMFNHRCHAIGEGVHFLMDRFGPYMLAGGQIKDIGDRVRDLFRDGTLDTAYARYFHVGLNPYTQTAKFYIKTTEDGGVKRCLSYNYALDRWSIETFPWVIGGTCELNVNGTRSFFVGKEDDRFCKETHTNCCDGIAATVSGTVSTVNQGTNVLTSTSSVFIAGHAGVPVVFTSGVADGESCVITTYTSGTQVTVDDIPAGVAAGDTFAIGGVAWRMKTGLMAYPRDNQNSNERSIEVVFKPTTNSGNYFNIRHYLNHKTTAEAAEQDVVATDEACKQEYGSVNGRVDMYKSRNDQYETVGFARKTFTSRHAHYGVSDRFVAVELRGVAQGEPIEISQVDIGGFK